MISEKSKTIEIDQEADAGYIYFKDTEEGEVNKTISLNENINADLDKEGKVLGIEILEASKNLPAKTLESSSE